MTHLAWLVAVISFIVVFYLLDGWKNALEARIAAIERQLDEILDELRYHRPK